ncbi:sugar transferase [Ferdinandcohnia sp. Marseille-Q9671]
MKRIFDLLIASLVLILFCPIIFITAILVKLKLGSPILFKQERPGYNGKSFVLYKFRTMTEERDKNGEDLPDYLRLSPIGNFIRKYSLDELPQLINVVKGDMSLVGPRPLLLEYIPMYSPFQARRHEVKPGITGWAQVNGRNAISWEKRFELDVWYVEHQSFLLDIRIILMTLKRLIKPEGINQDSHATMSDFKGSQNKTGNL